MAFSYYGANTILIHFLYTLLTKKGETSIKVKKSFILGFIFILGFLTINIPVIGGSEYQPLVLLLLSLCVYVAGRRQNKRIIYLFIGLLLFLLVPIFIHGITGYVNIKDISRVMVGPLFFLTSFSLLKRIPLYAYKFLICFHLAFLVLGVFSPDIALLILKALGLRAYEWNAYFSSEPSYFAINYSGMVSLMYLKHRLDGEIFPIKWLVFSIILLLSVPAVTSLFFMTILIFVILKQLTPRVSFLLIALSCMLMSGYFSILSTRNIDRVTALIDIGIEQSGEDLLTIANRVEPSGLWRPLTNVVGITLVTVEPLGFGHLSISNQLEQLSSSFPMLVNLVEINEVYNLLPSEFYTNAIVPSYVVFGGILLSLMVGLILLWVCVKVLTCFDLSGTSPLRYFVIVYLLVGSFWQSAITNPFWWIILGCCLCESVLKGKPIYILK